MRIAEVIGSVTMARVHPSLIGSRWLIGVPLSLKALRGNRVPDGEDVVMYDELGAGVGDLVGISEGGEAAAPFAPRKTAVDAYCSCILDTVTLHDS